MDSIICNQGYIIKKDQLSDIILKEVKFVDIVWVKVG